MKQNGGTQPPTSPPPPFPVQIKRGRKKICLKFMDDREEHSNGMEHEWYVKRIKTQQNSTRKAYKGLPRGLRFVCLYFLY